MLSYSRNVLLSRCLWWKGSVDFQTSRHCLTTGHRYGQLPLDSSTWNTMKSLGILRQFRGKRGGRSQRKDDGIRLIKSISSRSTRKLNIQDSFFVHLG
jgi:hypothetical protein